MNKSEALAILHEFNEALGGSATTNCVSLSGSQVSHVFTGGYQVKMKYELDSHSREILKDIVKKHNLTMKEQNDYVILQSFG